MSSHIHACHVCGDVFSHEPPGNEGKEAFDKAHTCANGHKVTVKYDPKVAAGLSEVCKAGGDARAYLAEADPVSYLFLELSENPALSKAVDAYQDALPWDRGMVLKAMDDETRSALLSFSARWGEAMEKSKAMGLAV